MSNDAYRWVARWYDSLFEPMNRGLRAIGLKMYSPQPGMEVLDVGCGTGAQLDLYLKKECSVSGVDPSPAMLREARHRLGDAASLHNVDASEIPSPGGFFDLVLCSLVLHEMDPSTRVAVIKEMRRVLKSTGRLLVIDYHAGSVRTIKGWFTKAVILVSEIAAGRRHFRNYRDFNARGGLPDLAREHQLVIEDQKIVSGGNLGVFLLSRE